ncbi:hypothetical protein [Streptomyces sp. NPDC058757]|uniref:hypothetical protein n=1 Tax=Streptomyces sp. NPDC058757 TaxID=3346626 RepID=UPI0036CEA02D
MLQIDTEASNYMGDESLASVAAAVSDAQHHRLANTDLSQNSTRQPKIQEISDHIAF